VVHGVFDPAVDHVRAQARGAVVVGGGLLLVSGEELRDMFQDVCGLSDNLLRHLEQGVDLEHSLGGLGGGPHRSVELIPEVGRRLLRVEDARIQECRPKAVL